jgi:hypothetical protein
MKKIIVLWVTILLGLNLHCIIELIPLFYGADIALPEAPGAMPAGIGWMFLLSYLIPMVCMVLVALISAGWFKITNLMIAALYTLFNLFHFVAHLKEGFGVQTVLLVSILAFSILLTLKSRDWWKEPNAA